MKEFSTKVDQIVGFLTNKKFEDRNARPVGDIIEANKKSLKYFEMVQRQKEERLSSLNK